MPIFQYKGYRADGSQASGTIEADGLQDAVLSIKALGVYPKDVDEYGHKEKGRFAGRYDGALLPYITRQLSTLLAAGVPLIDSLRALSEESSGVWKGLLVGVRDRVSGGSSLSRALEGYPKVFPDFFVNMVAAGEQSGTLDKILVRLADFLEKQAAIRSKVRTAMIYPIFMTSVGIVVMSFLFTFVVPKIVRIFENARASLPFVTVVLIAVSNLFVHYWWAMIIVAAACFLGARSLQRRNRILVDGVKLRLPGNVIQSLYFGRFTRTLGFLLEGGLPMLRSLELSAKSIGNAVLGERILRAAEKVAEGGRLSSSLEGFPSVLLQLIATGERSGTLVDVLNKAAGSYEEEFERRVQKALSLLEPLMILLMGLIVGFIVLAVLLPMFELNQLVK
jgi:general secretion pathway protein F